MTMLDGDVQADERGIAWVFALEGVPQPGPWARNARCRTAPWTIFFPERGDPTDIAKRLCSGCCVLDACRAYALDAGPQLRGIWGGMSERERRRAKR